MSIVSERAKSLARKISIDEQSDIFLYSGPINEDGFTAVIEKVFTEHEAVLLILSTNGGSIDSAFRIARYFQAMYKKFGVLIPRDCKVMSAGTLLTLGAHRLIMAEDAELGPLDAQLPKRDEIWERRSGLVLRNAFTSLTEHVDSMFSELLVSIKRNSHGSVSFKLAGELAAQMTIGLFSPIFSQITPDALGEDYRDLMIANEYGKRLAAVGGLITQSGISRLINDYPSHGFIIDKVEAQTIFRQVEDPSNGMYALVSELLPQLVGVGSAMTVEPLSKPDQLKTLCVRGDSGRKSKGLSLNSAEANNIDTNSEDKIAEEPSRLPKTSMG
jgi:hypothetical protein